MGKIVVVIDHYKLDFGDYFAGIRIQPFVHVCIYIGNSIAWGQEPEVDKAFDVFSCQRSAIISCRDNIFLLQGMSCQIRFWTLRRAASVTGMLSGYISPAISLVRRMFIWLRKFIFSLQQYICDI